jgi:hypothetical protein
LRDAGVGVGGAREETPILQADSTGPTVSRTTGPHPTVCCHKIGAHGDRVGSNQNGPACPSTSICTTVASASPIGCERARNLNLTGVDHDDPATGAAASCTSVAARVAAAPAAAPSEKDGCQGRIPNHASSKDCRRKARTAIPAWVSISTPAPIVAPVTISAGTAATVTLVLRSLCRE